MNLILYSIPSLKPFNKKRQKIFGSLGLNFSPNQDEIPANIPHYPTYEDNIINIIEHSLKLNITKFDISCIDDGGCSVTMDASKLTPNLNYNLLNKIAILWIMNYNLNYEFQKYF